MNKHAGVRVPTPDPRTPLYSLLATSAVTHSYVLQSVLEEGDMWSTALPGSCDHDTVVCSLTAHLGGDLRRHLLLGTYDQTVLVYAMGPDDGSSSGDEEDDDRDGTWQLVTKLLVGAPVLSLAFEDIVGDGVKKLLVLTADGVQVFSLEPQQVAAVLTHRLHQLLQADSSCPPAAPDAADLQRATRSLNF
ncbi:hypothetical protein FHG87_010367 [Trinorchestia longiramus]|nr:hypothetical protein FHG87_010367 [Trinorchestia longiramus]